MTAKRRAVEVLGFGLLLVLSLATFGWRFSTQPLGITEEQAESLLLAQSVVEGRGLKLTAASAVSAGPANLVWLGVQATVLELGGAAETWLPRVSFVLLALSLVVVSLRGALVWRRGVQVEDALPALALAFATAMSEAAALGSGASGWVLALALCAVLTGRGLLSGVSGGAAVAMGLLCLFRPAAAWLILASTPAWWIAARLEGRPATREALRFLLVASFTAAFVLGGRFVMLGALPLDGFLPSDEGVAGTAEFLGRQSRWFWAALTGALVGSVWRRFHLRGGGTLVAWVTMTLLLASWVPAARTLFLGVVPLLAMLVGDGLSAAREGTERAGVHRGLSWSAVAGLVLLLSLATMTSYSLGPVMTARTAPVPRPELREEIVRRGLREPFVAWSDGVEAAALFPEARVVVVRRASRAVEDQLLSEGPPDVVDPRVSLAEMPRLAGVVRAGAGGAAWLSEQSPDEDPRCPEGRLALLSTTPEMLAAQLVEDVSSEQVMRALSRWRCALSALEAAQLPSAERRRQVAEQVQARSVVFEQQGRLELALRAASLAASVSGEDVQLRARAERLRARWLAGAE